MADENEMSTPADNRELRKIIHTATGYGILTKAEIVREFEKTEGNSQ